MTPYTIAVVVDPAFGDKLVALAQRIHVWICDTPVNRRAAQAANARLEPGGQWNERGVTIFCVCVGETAEEMFVGRLPEIDLHHNEYSHDPPWSRMEVYGVAPSSLLRQELAEYGVTEFSTTTKGFVCTRAEPCAA